ncbi:MAG: transposase, partial [bacterium]
GYDTDELRGLLKDRNDRPIIPHREYNPIDQAANARIDDDDYHQRSKVESVFSVIKRLYGDRIRARTWYRQFREMLLRMVIYNLDRIIKDHFLCRTVFWFDVRHETAAV